jgi:hypothetical protein
MIQVGKGVNNMGEEVNDMGRPVERHEFDNLVQKVDDLEKQQTIHQVKIDSIEKTLDKISTNTSRTLWTVVAGIIMLFINYFFNPPQSQVPPEQQVESVDKVVSLIHLFF